MAGKLVIAVAVGLALCAAQTEGKEMDSKLHDQIAKAAAHDYSWEVGDVDVRPNAELDRPGCTFFLALHKRLPDHPTGNYAVLADERIMGLNAIGIAAAATLLRECGKDAPADWWAEVVTRFSGQVRGNVLKSASHGAAIRKIGKAGAEFAPPALRQDASSSVLTFYVMDYEIGLPSRVTATLSGDGVLRIDSAPLTAPAEAAAR